MTLTEAYAEELAALRSLLSQPAPGIHLLEFATIPQLEDIIADLRPICAERCCIELNYDPPRENAALLIDRAREEIQNRAQEITPLLILRPIALPDATHDGPATTEFWKALNYRREALGALSAQILLCVDPWHYGHLVDEALDLLSWVMPKFHLIPPPDISPAREKMLTGTLALAKIPVSIEAARARWDTFWPIVEEQLRSGPLSPSSIRRYILPLLESALAVGNLVHAKNVRDAVGNTRIPSEDLVRWHELNAILACGAADYFQVEDHANRLVELMRESHSTQLRLQAADALLTVTNLLAKSQQSNVVVSLYRNFVQFWEKLYGPEHPNTLSSRTGLASALSAQGKVAEAERECRAVLALQERVLGTEHPDTLASRNNLAVTLWEQGKTAEAEQEHRSVLVINESLLGPEHPSNLISRNNLAGALYSQGRYAEAEKEQRAVLAIQDRELGAEHPDTLSTRSNLAALLGAQGKLAEAEQMNRTVLSIRERVLGATHPEVFASCLNLASRLGAQGKKVEALAYARRALVGIGKIKGEEHPDIRKVNTLVELLESE